MNFSNNYVFLFVLARQESTVQRGRRWLTELTPRCPHPRRIDKAWEVWLIHGWMPDFILCVYKVATSTWSCIAPNYVSASPAERCPIAVH